jgi:hypothetical protein
MIKKGSDKIVRRKSKKLRKKTKKRTGLEWFFVFCFFLFLGSVLYVFFCSPLVSITSIEVRGTQRTDPMIISDHIEEVLRGEKFACIQNRNFFLIKKNNILEKILQDQRIKSVHVEKKFPQTVIVDIDEYDFVPVWCLGSKEGVCYELTTSGCIVREIDQDSSLITENEHFIIVDGGGDVVTIDQCVIDRDKMEKVRILGEELIYALDTSIVQPYTIDFRGSGEIRYQTNEGWYIVIDLDHPVDEILYIARLFVRKIDLPKSRTDLEYVDLRFPNRIFYKMKGSQEEEREDVDSKSDEIDENEN